MKAKEVKKVRTMLANARAKNALFRAYIASKRGGNGRGGGMSRSVILATEDGKTWRQFYKFWGDNHRKMAELALNPSPNEALHRRF